MTYYTRANNPTAHGIYTYSHSSGMYIIHDDILNRSISISPDLYCDAERVVRETVDRLYYYRRGIIDAFWAFFPPACGGWGYSRPRYQLLGDDIGPRVLGIVKRISDVVCDISPYDFGCAYNASASYLLGHMEDTYSQYKMHMELSGEELIYTKEEYIMVHIMLDCVKELLSQKNH